MRDNGLLSPYVIEGRDGELLGGVALHHFDPMRDTLEVGYWLLKDARGRGVATRSVRAAIDHAFSNGVFRDRGACPHRQRCVGARPRTARLRAGGSQATVPPPRRRAGRRDPVLPARSRRLAIARSLALGRAPAVPIDEARQICSQEGQTPSASRSSSAPRAAALREDVAWRRDERGRDGVVEEVRKARNVSRPANELTGSNAQSPT